MIVCTQPSLRNCNGVSDPPCLEHAARKRAEGLCGAAPLGVSTVLGSLLLAALLAVTTTASALYEFPVSVKVVSLMPSVTSSSSPLAKAFDAGFLSSLHSHKNRTSGNVTVQFVQAPMIDEDLDDEIDNLTDVDIYPHIILGPYDDADTEKVLPYLRREDVVAFSPITHSSSLRGWNPHLYYLTADPAAELTALLRYAVGYLRVRQMGFMYLSNASYGRKEYEFAVSQMALMGYGFDAVFSVKDTAAAPVDDDTEFDDEWNNFVYRPPRAVVLFGVPGEKTSRFVTRVLTDSRTAGAYLLAPFALQALVIDTCRHVVAAGVDVDPSRVITTGTNPIPLDSRYKAVEKFRDAATAYLGGHSNLYKDPQHFLHNDADGEMMMAGWIAGEVLVEALSNRLWIQNRSAFKESLFRQRRYLVEDISIGDFGGNCSGSAASGLACNCNQGGKMVFMKRFNRSFNMLPLEQGTMALRRSSCYNESYRLPAPLGAVSLRITDDPQAAAASMQYTAGAAMLLRSDFTGSSTGLFLTQLNSSMSNVTRTLRKELEERTLMVVMGVMTEAMLSRDEVVIVDPQFMAPRLTKFQRHVVHFSPTLEQQLFVLSEFLRNKTLGPVHAVVRSAEGRKVIRVVQKSLQTFSLYAESTETLQEREPLGPQLPESGVVIAIGLLEADVEILEERLDRSSNLHAVVDFSDFSRLYAKFMSTFRGKASAERLYFATSLPHWADNSTTSLTAQRFNAGGKHRGEPTPFAMRGFADAQLMRTLLSRMEKVTVAHILDVLYAKVVISVGDMSYGPFDSSECVSIRQEVKCEVNYGARDISVWSMARVFNASIMPLTPPITPSMIYEKGGRSRMSKQEALHFLVFPILGLLLLMMVIYLMIRYCKRRGRDNKNAPKNPTGPVTLIFTDIDGSTAQWAAHPELMPDAVAAYHRLIRWLIKHHQCYEVKVVGDSFMIACGNAFTAVQLVRDLQQLFLVYDWGTTAFDESYREFEEQKAEREAEYVPPTARLDPEEYWQMWSGLRVRAGVHTGLCDIYFDETTKGYDYYGNTPDIAARAQGIANGGQVLLTHATYMALSTFEREQVDVVELGAVSLHCAPEPVEMYQLNAVPGRTFAALRLDEEWDDNASDDCLVKCAGAAYAGDSSSNTAAVLTELFGPLPLHKQWSALQVMSERWNIGMARKGTQPSEEACSEVIGLLATKVDRTSNVKGSRLKKVGDASDGAVGKKFGAGLGARDLFAAGQQLEMREQMQNFFDHPEQQKKGSM